MRKEVPTQVSKEELTFPVSEIEPLLSGPATELPEYEPTMIKLKNGKTMVIRPLLKEEAPAMINYLKKFIDVNKDFYDIVGVRVCGEILGWLRNRLKDSYQLVGVIDGELAGFANARLMNDDIYISLHSMAYQRGGRVGAAMYYAKAKFAFDVLGAEEWWSTFESYNGWMRWGLGMAQPSYPWPEVQHELGGARVYYIRKDYWESTVKNYIKQVVGSDLESNVPKDLLDQAYDMKIPESPNI